MVPTRTPPSNSAGLTVGSDGAIVTTGKLAAGDYIVSGTDSDTFGSTGTWAYDLTVNPAATTTGLTSSLNPSTYGTSVTFTATVSPSAATGTVTFKDGSTPLCSAVALSSGSATCATSALSVASHSITAVYSGDTNFTTSTSAVLSQVINRANQTITFLSTAPTNATVGGTYAASAIATSNQPVPDDRSLGHRGLLDRRKRRRHLRQDRLPHDRRQPGRQRQLGRGGAGPAELHRQQG